MKIRHGAVANFHLKFIWIYEFGIDTQMPLLLFSQITNWCDNKCNETKPDQTSPDRIEPSQAKPNRIEPTDREIEIDMRLPRRRKTFESMTMIPVFHLNNDKSMIFFMKIMRISRQNQIITSSNLIKTWFLFRSFVCCVRAYASVCLNWNSKCLFGCIRIESTLNSEYWKTPAYSRTMCAFLIVHSL